MFDSNSDFDNANAERVRQRCVRKKHIRNRKIYLDQRKSIGFYKIVRWISSGFITLLFAFLLFDFYMHHIA